MKNVLAKKMSLAGSLLLILGLWGCEEYQSSIPYAPVYVYRNIDTEGLNSPGSYKYITSTNKATEHLGYGGIIIVHAFDEKYYAFDLSCPVEHSRSIRIGKPIQGLICHCDSCGEDFDLLYGLGTPTKKISKEALMPYSTKIDANNYITVYR
jgi:hypothetical protein